MTKIDVMNTVAKNHGWKNWDDLFWSGDISQAIIDDLMALYGDKRFDDGCASMFNVVNGITISGNES